MPHPVSDSTAPVAGPAPERPAAPQDTSLIRAVDLRKAYGEFEAVKGIDLV